jgi:tetratricopeptide (TPR) repeat protein
MLKKKTTKRIFCFVIDQVKWVICLAFLFGAGSKPLFCQDRELDTRDRDEIRSKAIGLVKDFEQLLNVLGTKGTTASDVEDIVKQATEEDGRMFYGNEVNIEDDLYSLKADSGSSKDVSIKKYLNDWDLFYTKGYDESVSFADLRLSDFASKEYRFIKVYFTSQLKNKHKDFDQNYPIRKRIALIRFEKKGETWVAWINGISFFSGKRLNGNPYTPDTFEEDYKPFIKEKKARLVTTASSEVDSAMTSTQINLQKQNDSLYAEAVKAQIQKSEEQVKRDGDYLNAIAKGDSLLMAKVFPAALEAYTEARAFKPFEIYARSKINELTRLLASGSSDPKDIADKQVVEGDQRFKTRDYEGARQAYQVALNIFPENQSIKDKIAQSDKIIRNKAEIRSRFMAKNFKLALKEYAKVIAEDKANPDYYYERAQCYLAMGDSKRAMTDLNKAIEHDGNFQLALATRSQVFQKTGDLIRAISDYATLLSIDPQNNEYHFRHGVLLALGNDLEAAVLDFDAAIQLDAKDVQSICAKSDALRRLNKLDEALSSAGMAIEVNPNFSGGQFQKGLVFLEKGQDDQASIAFSKAIRIGLNAEQEKILDAFNEEYLRKARDADARNETAEAVRLVKRAITVKPKSAESFYFLGLQNEKLGKLSDALLSLDNSVFIKDDYMPAYLKKGQILFLQKDFRNCLEPFYKVKRLDKKNVDASLGLGDAFVNLRQYDSAMVWYGAALEIKPDFSRALLLRGKCHFIKENYLRSLMDFEDAIKQDKRNAEAYFYKGKINKALKQFDKAVDDFNKALDLGYSKYECAVEVGNAYSQMGSRSKAIRYFTSAIKEDPNKGKAYELRGLGYLIEEDYKNALADLDEALKIDTSLAQAQNRIELGFLKLRFNDLEGAEFNFNRALDFDSYSPRANYGLAATFFLQGKKEISMTTFEQAFIPRKLEYDKIKKDPWMKTIVKDKEFKKRVNAYFK